MTVKFMNEVFDKHNVGQDYRDYIFEDTNNIPQYLVMWNWNDILKDLNKKIELTNKLMIRIYDLCIGSAEIAGLKDFLHFELYNDKVESNYDKKRKLIFLKIVELLSLSKKAKIENILYYILKSDNAYGEATAKYLFNNYKKNEILNILDLFGFSYLTKELFFNLLKLDYDNYFDIFVKSFKKVDYSFKCLDIFLPIIKKEEELKDLIVFSLVKYFSSNDITYKGVKLKAKDIDILENVLSTNSSSVNDSKFNKLADKISKDLNKKNKDLDYLNFYCMWFENSKREFNDNFFKKLRDLFFAISPVGAISEYINQKGILAEKILTEYNVPLYKYLQFLIYETAAWNDCDCDYDDIKAKEGVENKLTSYIESNFNDFKQAFDLVNNDIKESVIRDFYDKNIIGFNNIIVELDPSTTSKAIKNLIVDILGKDNNNKEIVLNFLKEKKSHVREIAVMILTKWDLPDTQEILKPLLKTEKSAPVKNLIKDYLATIELENSDDSDFFSKEAILERAEKEQHSLNVKNMPFLIWKEDNKEMSAKFSRHLIYLFNKGNKVLKATEETKKVVSLVTTESLTLFLDSITYKYTQKYDWYLRAIPFTKSDKYLSFLKEYIGKLIRSSRGVTAAKVVDVIAEFKTIKAIQLLDHLSLKKNAKNARVNRASDSAVDSMAKEMNLTREDLLDFIIPDFGFDKKGELSLDFGPRKFIVSLQPDLTMLIKDDAGKSYKNLPKVGKNDDAAIGNESTKLFKSIKKDLKKQVKLEKDRLERGFSESRFWKGENWLKLFVNNPVMRTFAMGLVWGIYKDGKLIDSFRYLDDGSFSNIDDDELNIKNDDSIALIHPVELSDIQLIKWKEILEDYEITQSFEQINRPIFKFKDENKDKDVLDDFKGFMLGRFVLRNGLFNLGWERDIEDDIYYRYYNKTYADGTFVSLDFLGDYIGNYDDNKEVPIYDITINKDGKKLKVSEISPRLYSELYYELKKITDKGSGFNAEWEKVSW